MDVMSFYGVILIEIFDAKTVFAIYAFIIKKTKVCFGFINFLKFGVKFAAVLCLPGGISMNFRYEFPVL